MGKNVNTQHIRDASPEHARALAFQYYRRAVIAERERDRAQRELTAFKDEHQANLASAMAKLVGIAEIIND